MPRLSDYFSFRTYRHPQRWGLVVCAAGIVAWTLVARSLEPAPNARAIEELRVAVGAADEREQLAAVEQRKKRRHSKQRKPAENFRFDPNTIGKADLQRLGLSVKQADVWLKYQASGEQVFRKPGDIQRLRFLNGDDKDRLAGLANFPQTSKKRAVPYRDKPRERFAFDPNTVSADSLALLGFKPWEIKSFEKYRSYRPQTFRTPEDMLRLKALDTTLVRELLPLVRIAPAESPLAPAATPTTYAAVSTPRYAPKPPPAPGSIDINTADTTLLKTLPGVGSYRARRIVSFREALGGFSSLEQVGNTRGLPDSTYRSVLAYLTIGPIYRPLDVNRASSNELRRHPYVSSKLASVIVRYREQHGPYPNAEALLDIRLITPELLNRLRPYLVFD